MVFCSPGFGARTTFYNRPTFRDQAKRNRLRQEVELKEREFALKQQELGLQAMGISTMQDVSTALNRIAFQMLIGNVISADANGMTLQYWEITR
jgi:hypothetical protein